MTNTDIQQILAEFWRKLKKELAAEIVPASEKPGGDKPVAGKTLLEPQAPPPPERRASGTILEKGDGDGHADLP